MERFVFRIQLNGVIAEDQPIDRLGIKNRSVEGFKLIVFNHNATLGSAVEILLLSLQVGNLRIDGDNRIGKLEQISQRVYKTVLTDNDMTAGTGLKPTVAIAAKQNSSPEVWSNKLFSTIVLRGVLNKEPRARLLRITLPENKTSGVHVRFSIPKPLCSLITWSTGS